MDKAIETALAIVASVGGFGVIFSVVILQEEKETISIEAYKRTDEINEKFKKLNNEIKRIPEFIRCT